MSLAVAITALALHCQWQAEPRFKLSPAMSFNLKFGAASAGGPSHGHGCLESVRVPAGSTGISDSESLAA